MKSIYLKTTTFFILSFFFVNISSGQVYDPLTDPFQAPKSIPEQLDLTELKDTFFYKSYFDPNHFEIRIWENDRNINKIKLWQIQKNNNDILFKELNYSLTSLYYKRGKIIYDKYDSTLWRRLPVFGGNGVIGYKVSNIEISTKNESAEANYNKLVENNIFQLYSFDFRVTGEIVELDGVKFEDIILFPLQSSYTVEIASENFYLIYDFNVPDNIEDYTDKSKGMFFANEILKILKKQYKN